MPTWKDLERFLKHDRWEYRPGNSGNDRTYIKKLSNGERLWTRVSKSSAEIGSGLFAAILKHQLKASKDYFNKVLSNKRSSTDNPADRN
jgi:hypothetical protein